jgi:cyclase
VKTVKFKDPAYVGDPINAVKIFNEKEVDELMLLDIMASREGRGPNFELIEEIVSEAFMPVCYGGGISSIEQIVRLFQLGVEKISLNHAAQSNPKLVKEAAERFGSSSIVVSIDVGRNFFGTAKLYTLGGTNQLSISPLQAAIQAQDQGAGELLLNVIPRDGLRAGLDLDLIKQIAPALKIPLIACGGAGQLDDLKQAALAGASAVAAGSLFVYQGKHRAVLISYPSYSQLRELLGAAK